MGVNLRVRIRSRFWVQWFVFVLLPLLVIAGPVGPNYSGTVGVSGAGTAWSNTANAVGSSSGDYASVTLTANGELSEYLEFTNFGFSIPSGYQIDGVVVEVNHYQDATKIEDNSVYLIKGGVIQTGGDNKGNDNPLPGGPPGTTTTYGNATDTWSVALTEADIEATGFGVAIRFDKQGGGGAETGYVDWVRITVYASTAASGSTPESDREVATGMGSDNGWTPLNNEAGASDDVYESVTMAKGEESQYLIVDNFGFSIPAANDILGIQVSIERSSSGNRTSDFKILLVDETGAVLTGGDDKADLGTDWPTTDGIASYGGSADLWGQIAGFWTPAKINDADFGVAIAVLREDSGPAGNRTAQVDHVTITITHEDPVALPIELVHFSAKPSNQGVVELSWQTASETNNDYFTIERSLNAVRYEEVTRIDGANNSNHPINYSAVDARPYGGVSYYRLKQTDFDGTFSYSPIVSVNVPLGDAPTMRMYPNPLQGGGPLRVELRNIDANGALTFQIYDTKGMLVHQTQNAMEGSARHADISVDLQLEPGIYIGRLSTGSQVLTHRLVVD